MNDSMPREWDRQPDEPSRWFVRFERYRLLGPSRTFTAVANLERAEKGRKESKDPPGTWRHAASVWSWRERAEAWDRFVSDQAAKEAERRRIEILTTGFSQREERVKVLNSLASLLLTETQTEEKRWLPDVKAIGSSKDGTFEKVDIIRFNSSLIEQLRGVLDDIAKEMGERKSNDPVEVVLDDVSGLTDQQRADRIAAILDAARARRDRSAAEG